MSVRRHPILVSLLRASMLGAGVLSGANGCSMFFVSGPPTEVPRPPDWTCTTQEGWPALDTLLAGFQAVRLGLAVNASDASYEHKTINRQLDIFLGATLLGWASISAISGFTRVFACRDALEKEAAQTPPWQSVVPRRSRRPNLPPTATTVPSSSGSGPNAASISQPEADAGVASATVVAPAAPSAPSPPPVPQRFDDDGPPSPRSQPRP